MNLKVIKGPLAIILGLCLMTALTPSMANAFTDLTISGNITFDDGNTFADDTATGTGSMDVVSGGVPSSTSFDGTGSFTGVNPLTGNLTAVGDGFGGTAAFTGADFSEFLTGWDLQLDLGNSSGTESYQISFQVDYDNEVDSSGPDAYGRSEFFVGTSFGGDDIFATYLSSDTLNGNENTDGSASGFGGLLAESGSFFFDLILNPGDSTSLFGFWNLEGGVFDDADPGTAFASIDSFISITGVENLTAPPAPIPEPSTVALLGFGLVGLGIMAHRRRMNS